MPEVPTTGMTDRAPFCMYPEAKGGCEEMHDLVPVHYKLHSPDTGELVYDHILGWLCKPHALELMTTNLTNPQET